VNEPWIYRIRTVVEVKDGDTFILVVEKEEPYDFGFHVKINPEARINCRLLGWDTPEKNKGSAFERGKAREAEQQAAAYFDAVSDRLWVRTEKDPADIYDDFGRWLGDIWTEDDAGNVLHLGQYLANLKLATPWPIRWRDQYDRRDLG
jgi:endonuclease YncB( thermonuclease family)